MSTIPRGRPRIIPNDTIRRIKERGEGPLAWGEQKIIAHDYGVSAGHVCQILKGLRRANG